MDPSYATGLKNPSQVVRRISEAWGVANLYCAACTSDRLEHLPPNTEAADFACLSCSAKYQLKAVRNWNGRRIPDAGYDAMVRAFRSDSIPNLLVMHYLTDWRVRHLLLIPSFLFSLSAIERRKPLAPTARRAGWVGCNILLNRIAQDGKIPVIAEGIPITPGVVRDRYERVRPFGRMNVPSRSWTLDVLNRVRMIQKDRFSLQDVYAFEHELAVAYPGNRNVRAKIRQQLQVLRDLRLLVFEGHGWYRLTPQ